VKRLRGAAAAGGDAAEEVFWRLWQHGAAYERERPFGAWLYGIARHVALNERKKPYRRATPFSGLPAEEQQRLAQLSVDRPGAEETVALREQVRAALQALNAEQLLCVILREYQGLP